MELRLAQPSYRGTRCWVAIKELKLDKVTIFCSGFRGLEFAIYGLGLRVTRIRKPYYLLYTLILLSRFKLLNSNPGVYRTVVEIQDTGNLLAI